MAGTSERILDSKSEFLGCRCSSLLSRYFSMSMSFNICESQFSYLSNERDGQIICLFPSYSTIPCLMPYSGFCNLMLNTLLSIRLQKVQTDITSF